MCTCRAAYLRVIEGCQQLLNDLPTTLEQDQQLLTAPMQELAHQPWANAQHGHLALAYRMARKETLQAVISDLEALSRLLNMCDS